MHRTSVFVEEKKRRGEKSTKFFPLHRSIWFPAIAIGKQKMLNHFQFNGQLDLGPRRPFTLLRP
jgi:hypothetical protein